jgi:hypothetical protein
VSVNRCIRRFVNNGVEDARFSFGMVKIILKSLLARTRSRHSEWTNDFLFLAVTKF